jgi:hypothetical protein
MTLGFEVSAKSRIETAVQAAEILILAVVLQGHGFTGCGKTHIRARIEGYGL